MKLPLYQIDAFTNGPFTGNPAAVCPLPAWLDDKILQNIAMENNLSETAFFVARDGYFDLRWFTPMIEVDLCGHATLATAFTLFEILDYKEPEIRFESRSGTLLVSQNTEGLTMDFPADKIVEIDRDPAVAKGLGREPVSFFKGRSDWMCVYETEEEIRGLDPNFGMLAQTGGRGIIVTAPGHGQYDFVSRGFFPQTGIDEDPATGSAHTTLTPYWSKVLGKSSFNACQLSKRKGFFHCRLVKDRVLLTGKANKYLIGEIYI